MTERTRLASSPVSIEGAFDGVMAAPEAPGPVAVLLLPEMFGLTDAMSEATVAFARQGLPTLAPNLFWRSDRPGVLAYEGPERQLAWERLQALDLDHAVADVERAALWLEDRMPPGSPVVAVGHCIGGRLALRALPRTRLAGSVSYYGLGISSQGAELAELAKPAELHYGLADEHVPATEVAAVRAARAGNPNVILHLYAGAGHSFCNPNRPMFDPAAAALAMQRTLAFIDRIAARPAAGRID